MTPADLGKLVERRTDINAMPARPPGHVCTRYLLSTMVGVVLVLAGAATVLVIGHDGVSLACAALVLAVPAAAQISGGVADFRMWLSGPRNPAPPQLPAEAAAEALAATVVVYPVIVYDDADVVELLDSMGEGRRAAGDGFAMHLALVDFADSNTATCPGDAALRAAIVAGIAALNGPGNAPPMAALFRRRLWNAAEGVFMGWERKRGKLEELTGLVAGRTDTSFVVDSRADREVAARLHASRYLLTLDVGNRLLPDSAWRLVATIAHPDNAPVLDPDTGLVTRGYGFVRPIDLPPQPGTVFEWLLQPYPVPEDQPPPVQTFFGRDVFLGQGVIDVAAYRAVLAGRIPPGRVLSHDKLEGMHVRTAAIADARVADARVSDYLLFRRREHRWTRGDVHLVPWMVTSGRRDLRPLPAIDRWQIARDILGHLYPAAMVALLALGWLAAPPGQVGWWTVAVLAAMAQPVVIMPLLPVVIGVRIMALQLSVKTRRRPPGRTRRQQLLLLARRIVQVAFLLAVAEVVRLLLWLPLLADRAVVAVDATCRATYRIVSRRRVLQWTSSVKAGRIEPGLLTRVRHLWLSGALALALGAGIAVVNPDGLAWAAPLLVAWLAAPAFAYWTARPAPWLHRLAPLTPR